jgi:predicted O-methyltransferase YrrM
MEIGWYKSVKKQIPINKIGEPIPWYTYSLIDFIQTRLNKDMEVFEYGSGYSTIWWAKFVKKVISCEHDKEWIEKLKPFSNNVEILFKDIEDEYENFILDFKEYFDVIIIDGVKRDICSKNCLLALKSSGVIIHDDTDNQIYEKNCHYFKINGFKRMDFWGMKPSTHRKYCTSIFYKENNCFGI